MRMLSTMIGLLILGGTMTACTTVVDTPATALPVTTASSLVWPPPPLAPRIRLVANIMGARDLGIEPSFWNRLKRAIAGDEDEFFVRPTDVATRGETLYVADPGTPALWIFDPSRRQVHRVFTAGKQPLVSPVAVAPGPGDRVFLADSYHRRVFVFDIEGRLLSTIDDNGFKRPAGLAYDQVADRLYIADSAAHRVWVFTADGRRIGSIGGRGTGHGAFNFPTHVAVGNDGTIYVNDALGFRIQMFAGSGQFVDTFGRHGNGSGDFSAPKGVAVDSDGHIYVVDALFETVQIFDRNGRLLLNFGEHGGRPGQFWLPGGIFINAEDRIYVADAYNRRIQVFQYLK